jgi:hypothetical protein
VTRSPLTTRYLRELIPAMPGYMIALSISIALLSRVEMPSPPWLMWILPLMIGTYGVAQALFTRRYR